MWGREKSVAKPGEDRAKVWFQMDSSLFKELARHGVFISK